MMKFKRLLTLLLALICGCAILATLSGCGKTGTEEGSESATQAGTEGGTVSPGTGSDSQTGENTPIVDPVVDLVLVQDGRANVVIVGDSENAAVTTLQTTVQTVTGVAPTICAEKDVPENAIRIYVKNIVGADPGKLAEKTNYFGWWFGAYEKNFYLLAYDDMVLQEGASGVADAIAATTANGKWTRPSDYSFSKTTSRRYPAADAPYFAGAKEAELFNCDDGYYMAFLTDAEKESFEAYCEKLSANGFTEEQTNEINGNLFRTYSKGQEVLYTYWVEYSKQVRVIVSKDGTLPAVSDSGNNTVCTSLIKQLDPCPTGGSNEGEGYVIRLNDGRFIVIDGGYECENTTAKNIYDFLKAEAPDPDHVVIATWYITHTHGDHLSALRSFAKQYKEDSSVTIESFMINKNMIKELTQYCGGISEMSGNLSSIFAAYPNATVYKPFTGQKYTFSTTTINILYTIPDYAPNRTIPNESDATSSSPLKGDYNLETMVSQFNIHGTTFFVMGDTTVIACNEMSKRFGEALQSTYVQVSHHGLAPTSTDVYQPRRNNSTKEIYKLIYPDYAFLPCSAAKKSERMNYEVNRYLKSFLTKLYCAGEEGGDVRIDLNDLS